MVACHHDPVHGSEPGKLPVGASFCHQLPPRFHQGSTVVMRVWRHKEKEHKVNRAHQVSSVKSCICVSNHLATVLAILQSHPLQHIFFLSNILDN